VAKQKDEKIVDENAAEIEANPLANLICEVDLNTGELTCAVSEEQWAAIEKLPNKPQRLVFELPTTEQK